LGIQLVEEQARCRTRRMMEAW